jgi:predicted CXXCH cytochrome family protein
MREGKRHRFHVTRALPVLLVGLWVAACNQDPPVVQPIQFSHKAHVEKGLQCDACHTSVQQAAAATVPGSDTCMLCHQGAITDSPEEEKVRQYAEKGAAIPWRRIYQLPAHVYFSHRRHVVVARIDCVKCHGAVASLVAPAAYPLVKQNMPWCLECHRTRGATQDCIHCHR